MYERPSQGAIIYLSELTRREGWTGIEGLTCAFCGTPFETGADVCSDDPDFGSIYCSETCLDAHDDYITSHDTTTTRS